MKDFYLAINKELSGSCAGGTAFVTRAATCVCACVNSGGGIHRAQLLLVYAAFYKHYARFFDGGFTHVPPNQSEDVSIARMNSQLADYTLDLILNCRGMPLTFPPPVLNWFAGYDKATKNAMLVAPGYVDAHLCHTLRCHRCRNCLSR